MRYDGMSLFYCVGRRLASRNLFFIPRCENSTAELANDEQRDEAGQNQEWWHEDDDQQNFEQERRFLDWFGPDDFGLRRLERIVVGWLR